VNCSTAQSNFDNITQFCTVPYIANGFADPLSINITDVDKFCSGECVTQIDLHLAQVVRSCWANGTFDPSTVNSFRDALIASKTACLRVEESYCFSVWQNLTHLADSLKNGTLTREQILGTCWSDCADEQHAQLIRFGANQSLGTTGFLKLLCPKVGDNEYCALTYQDVENGKHVQPPPPPPPSTNSTNSTDNTNGTSSSNSTDTTNGTSGSNSTAEPSDVGNGTCSLCYRRFVQRANKTLSLAQGAGGVSNFDPKDFADKVNHLTYQCTQDGKKLCVDKIDEDALKNKNHQNLSVCGDIFDNVSGPITDNCTSECAKALKDLEQDLGCCTMTYFQRKYNSSISEGDNPAIPHIFNFIKDKCKVPKLPNSCSKKRIDFSLVLVNVRESWVNESSNNETSHWLQLANAVRRDVSSRLGVPLSSVVIKDITEYTPSSNITGSNSTDDVQCIDGERRVRRGVRVNGYVLPQTDAELVQLQGSFAKAILENRIDLSDTASWVPLDFDARFDVLSPFALDSINSSVSRVNNPGA
jgi:hypothetical protein